MCVVCECSRGKVKLHIILLLDKIVVYAVYAFHFDVHS